MKFKTITAILLLFIEFYVIFTAYTRNAFACSPAGPNAWYNTEFTVDPKTLPKSSVGLTFSDSEYTPFYIYNNSNLPLYIAREKKLDWVTYPNSEIPDNFEPIYKLTVDKIYNYGREDFRDENPIWVLSTTADTSRTPIEIPITSNIYVLDRPSRQVYEDDRPENVDIPSPQNFYIHTFYGNEYYKITGTIAYSLNTQYDPKAFAKGIEFCNQWQNSLDNPITRYYPYVILFLPFVSGAALLFIIYRVFGNKIRG